MDLSEMHQWFRQYAQQMGMQNVRAILPEQIDMLINTSITDTVNQVIQENIAITNDRVITDNSKIGQINALSTLYKVVTFNISPSSDENDNTRIFHFFAKNRNKGLLTTDFLKSTNIRPIPDYMYLVDFSLSYRRVKGRRGYTGASIVATPKKIIKKAALKTAAKTVETPNATILPHISTQNGISRATTTKVVYDVLTANAAVNGGTTVQTQDVENNGDALEFVTAFHSKYSDTSKKEVLSANNGSTQRIVTSPAEFAPNADPSIFPCLYGQFRFEESLNGNVSTIKKWNIKTPDSSFTSEPTLPQVPDMIIQKTTNAADGLQWLDMEDYGYITPKYNDERQKVYYFADGAMKACYDVGVEPVAYTGTILGSDTATGYAVKVRSIEWTEGDLHLNIQGMYLGVVPGLIVNGETINGYVLTQDFSHIYGNSVTGRIVSPLYILNADLSEPNTYGYLGATTINGVNKYVLTKDFVHIVADDTTEYVIHNPIVSRTITVTEPDTPVPPGPTDPVDSNYSLLTPEGAFSCSTNPSYTLESVDTVNNINIKPVYNRTNDTTDGLIRSEDLIFKVTQIDSNNTGLLCVGHLTGTEEVTEGMYLGAAEQTIDGIKQYVYVLTKTWKTVQVSNTELSIINPLVVKGTCPVGSGLNNPSSPNNPNIPGGDDNDPNNPGGNTPSTPNDPFDPDVPDNPVTPIPPIDESGYYDDDSLETVPFPVRIIDHAYLADTLNDFVLKPRLRSPIIVIYNTNVINSNGYKEPTFDLYIDKFTRVAASDASVRYILPGDLVPYELTMSYIAKPREVRYREDMGGENINCDLPEYMHVDILKHAVDLYRIAITGSLQATQQQEQVNRRENLRNNYRNEGYQQ